MILTVSNPVPFRAPDPKNFQVAKRAAFDLVGFANRLREALAQITACRGGLLLTRPELIVNRKFPFLRSATGIPPHAAARPSPAAFASHCARCSALLSMAPITDERTGLTPANLRILRSKLLRECDRKNKR